MHLFVSKFNELQSDRHDQEGKEQHSTKQVLRKKLRVGVPIERHASTVYTRAMYEKFCDELFESGSFAIFKRINASEFILVDTKNEEEIEAKHFRVKLEGDNKISCECGFYEHMGMLCRHTLKVLVHLDKMEIPAGNIMRRWTKEGHIPCKETSISSALEQQSHNMQRKMLLAKACELTKVDDKGRLVSFGKTIEEVIGNSMVSETSGQQIGEVKDATTSWPTSKPTSCPPRTIFGGRPPNTGLKSWIASTKKPAACQADDPSTKASEWPEEENPAKKKTKSILELMQLK